MIGYVLSLMIFIIIAAFVPRYEYFAPDGICDCCTCGFLSCKECESRRHECCGDGFGYDRYTFS